MAVKQKIIMLLLLSLFLIQGTVALAQRQGIEATPAVVNPVLRSELRQTISLDGKWNFATDPKGIGETKNWYLPDVLLPNKTNIQVPGCWEALGVGSPGDSRSTTPETMIMRLRSVYVGTAWYKREVTVPADWQGKELWLKFGGVHSQGWFWANGNYLGHDKSYCGTYKYRVTDLVDEDGKLVIAVKVRNDVPSGKGLFAWVHRFGGLYRSVEFEATDPLLIDYAYVQGDLDARSAGIHITLRNTTTSKQSAEVKVAIATVNGCDAGSTGSTLTVEPGQTEVLLLTTALNPFKPWSPDNPNLYRADITVKRNGRAVDGWGERFGVRKWEVRDGHFYFNNRKFMVRGYGDDYIYPLTISSPPSRDIHREHLQLARSFGFNYVRHHTHCEIPEFFDAADEVGIMVQPELPYYGPLPSAGDAKTAGAEWFRPREDLRELVTHYRRYVSLSTYCGGNEGYYLSPVDQEVYALAGQLDPTRLYLSQDGGKCTPENSDFATGPMSVWGAGDFRWSYDIKKFTEMGRVAQWLKRIPLNASRPWFAHEYMNLAVSADPRLESKYTGVCLPAITMEQNLKQLQEAGLDADVWGDALSDSGHYLQRMWQKIGLESARLDGQCDGYIYWTMTNIGTRRDQGLVDSFWGVKRATPEYFRQFNSPTAVLAVHNQLPIGPDQRILAEGDTLKVDWWINHFDKEPLEGAVLAWRVETDRSVLGRGRIESINIVAGQVGKVGDGSMLIPDITQPVKARLIAGIDGTQVENSWDLWLFPKCEPSEDAGKGLAATSYVYERLKSRYPAMKQAGPGQTDAAVLLTDKPGQQAMDALNAGKTVVQLSLPDYAPGVKPGWWWLHEQGGTAIADHPVFGEFPHEGHLSQLFFRIMGKTVTCREPEYRGVEKMMVTSGGKGYLAHVFQAKAGNGKLLGCGLNLYGEQPEAVWLLDQIIQYARSLKFAPQGEYDMERNQRMLGSD